MTAYSATPLPADGTSDSLEVHLMGVVDHDSALVLQQRLAYEISGRSDRQGGLLICEHPPVITVGREGSSADILVQPQELTSRLLEVRWLNRGGGCLLHAPGQLAVYPVVPLDRLGLGLCEYRRRLEESVIDVCRELRIAATRCDDQPGVFCRCGQFAFVGVAVRSWVAFYGLFINVNLEPSAMRLVRWNASGQRVTSLSTQKGRHVPMHAVRESVIHNLAARLGYEGLHLYTGHPWLERTRKRVHVFA